MIDLRSGRVGIYTALLLATIALAYVLGTSVGNYANERKTEQQRKEMTAAIVKNMKNLAEGEKIPDHEFTDLEGRAVKLSEWLGDRTILTFFEPDCHTCIDEIKQLRKTLADTLEYRHFIYISQYSLEQLKEVRKAAGVPLRILHDRDRVYAEYFGVSTLPFHMVVDKSLKVERVLSGIPKEADYEWIVEGN